MAAGFRRAPFEHLQGTLEKKEPSTESFSVWSHFFIQSWNGQEESKSASNMGKYVDFKYVILLPKSPIMLLKNNDFFKPRTRDQSNALEK